MDILSTTEADTEAMARTLAATLRAGDVLFLRGPLGMGKSVFARALIRTLCADPDMEVPSPTFTLVQTYDTPLAPLWHFDLYRLEDPDEIWELGWEDARSGPIILVEWPERLGRDGTGGLALQDRLEIVFTPLPQDPGARTIRLTPHGTWKDRL
jgi:tRNA threonylcarbamoyladenosine biosynthesis protein TsaE